MGMLSVPITLISNNFQDVWVAAKYVTVRRQKRCCFPTADSCRTASIITFLRACGVHRDCCNRQEKKKKQKMDELRTIKKPDEDELDNDGLGDEAEEAEVTDG